MNKKRVAGAIIYHVLVALGAFIMVSPVMDDTKFF